MGAWFGWLAVVLVPLLLAAAIAAVPVRARAELSRHEGDDNLSLQVKTLFGLLKFKWEIPMMKLGKNGLQVEELAQADSPSLLHAESADKKDIGASRIAELLQDAWKLLRRTENLTGLVRRTLNKVEISRWTWRTTIGTGDAVWTAMSTGAVWSLQTAALGLLSQLCRLTAKPQMDVQPDYRSARLETSFDCIAEIRLGNAILAGLQLLVRMMRTEGGVRLWQNILFKA
ncbi:DUF2953 domain-containing protein [Paenibacillus sp. FSL W8-1187]|uniref:Putative secreted protein n=1 Tax=Paenibacillus pasadenensis TaxID=217090 RepID=A0A2N5N5H6_9BACL|nr:MULTISPECIES: DUF2953 domain-containing protein [Paenibacillus]PLT45601.1 putative secreted protein [Paenibacillus pasadenensis]QGG56054.1 DUF2953 domain-containing protein [Paenibacillus sp. B01]